MTCASQKLDNLADLVSNLSLLHEGHDVTTSALIYICFLANIATIFNNGREQLLGCY